MKIALFVFGMLSGAFAFLVALGALWVVTFGLEQRFEKQQLFFNMTGIVSGFATLGGLCFVASAVARHAESSAHRSDRSQDEPPRTRPAPSARPIRGADADA